MALIRRLGTLVTTVFILSAAYALLSLARGLDFFIGYPVAPQSSLLQGLQSSLGMLLVFGVILMIGALVLILTVGYIALTGWRDFSSIPALLKLILAFVVGLVILGLSSPLGTIIPIPFLPTVIVAAGLWVLLRQLSGRDWLASERYEIGVEEAEAKARQDLQTRIPNVALTAAGAQIEEGRWKLNFTGNDGSLYNVVIDARTGGTLGWGKS
jgi:hypothetical protein